MQKIKAKRNKVLITGIDGFLGSNLSFFLEKKGYDVYGLTRANDSRENILSASITDYLKIEEFVKKNKINVCIHLAGESVVEKGQSNPMQTFETNIKGALNILEIGRNHKLERIIIVSTSHVYGKNKLPYYEGYTPRPTRPYETSKACVDLIAQSYVNSFNLPVLIPRFVNIYGPGDTNFTRLIPKTIQSVIQKKEPKMWGGNAIRDFLYIDDALSAFLVLLTVDIEKVGKNRVFNFGTGDKLTIRQVIENIVELGGSSIGIKKIEDARENEISAQYVSSVKAKKLLAWNSKVGIEEGLERTMEWHKRVFEDKK